VGDDLRKVEAASKKNMANIEEAAAKLDKDVRDMHKVVETLPIDGEFVGVVL